MRDEEKWGEMKQWRDAPCLLAWLCWLYTFHLFCGGEISKRIKRAILLLLILSFFCLSHSFTLSDGHICSLTHHTDVQWNSVHVGTVRMQ